MSTSLPLPDYTRSDLPEHKHQRILQAALQVARPVIVAGKVGYIHTLTSQQIGGRIEMIVYLMGNPAPVNASEVTLQDLPQ